MHRITYVVIRSLEINKSLWTSDSSNAVGLTYQAAELCDMICVVRSLEINKSLWTSDSSNAVGLTYQAADSEVHRIRYVVNWSLEINKSLWASDLSKQSA